MNKRLYPEYGLLAYIQPSERRIYEALSLALPAGWSAWHSLKIRVKGAEFAEGDFVIADPQGATLILEVKGGLVNKEDGVWLQNGKPMRTPPLDQSHRFVRLLITKFSEQDLVAPPIGVAVAFPDTYFDAQPTQGDLEGNVIGERELRYLDDVLPGVLEKALPARLRRRASPGWVEFLHSLWCECRPAAMSLSCAVKRRQADRVRLDGNQFEALERIIENDLVLVRGRGGHGEDASGPRAGAAGGASGGADGKGRIDADGLEAVAREIADGTIKIIACGDKEDEAQEAVGREIRTLKAEGFAESDLAVVSLRGMMYPGNIMHREELGGCELAQATNLEKRERVI